MNRPGTATQYSDRLCAAGSGGSTAIAQYGELFQGVTRDSEGSLHRCLVSLPCRSFCSNGKFAPGPTPELTVVPGHKQKALRAAAVALDFFGASGIGGILTIESNILEGKGLGSSTADCTAAVLSVACALNEVLSAERIAELVVRAETASGSVMFGGAVLFAHREGKVLEHYYRPLPTLTVLGFDTESDRIVETLRFPPVIYSAEEIDVFNVLIVALRRAIQTQDAQLLGRVATASAEINQKFLQKPFFEETCQAVREIEGLGVAVAHSGTVAGVLLDGKDTEIESKVEALQLRLTSFGIREILRFEI